MNVLEKNIKIINFNPIGDHRGSLVALEGLKNIPFNIQRVYYIFDTKQDIIRGNHAHTDLEQVLICLNGSCKIKLDNGTDKKEILLNKRDEGLYLSGLIWREMYDFSEGCVLMVLASKHYDENEYIRDYKKFLGLVNGKR